jgi:RHS repeat-associated protein
VPKSANAFTYDTLKPRTITYCAANVGTFFYNYDANGHLLPLGNAADGTRTNAADYESGPFSEVIRATGPMAKLMPFMFSTKFYDWETGLYYYGARYYNASTGKWPSRDPIGEKGGPNLYAFVRNDSIGKIDRLGTNATDLWNKMNGRQIPKATGLTAGGSLIAKIPGLSGIVAGGNVSVMFFPDTCEVSAFAVQPIGTNSIGGIYGGLGGGIEAAVYYGDPTPGHASAASYSGPFATVQAGANIGGISGFIGQKNQYGGNWIGGSVTVGPKPGGGLGELTWNYIFMPTFTTTLWKCPCYAEILAIP